MHRRSAKIAAGLALLTGLCALAVVAQSHGAFVVPPRTAASRTAAATSSAETSSAGSAGISTAKAKPAKSPETGRVLVRLKTGVTRAQRVALGIEHATKLAGGTVLSVRPPASMTPDEYTRRLQRSSAVAAAGAEHLLRLATTYTQTPNDPYFQTPTSSWALKGSSSAHFDQAWPHLSTAKAGPAAVRVAVLDSGYFFSQEDSGNVVGATDECATYDPQSDTLTTDTNVTPVTSAPNSQAPAEDISHGTMVASEIAEAPNNGLGTLGAAYDTQVWVYKVMGTATTTNYSQQITRGDAVIPDSALINAIHDAVQDAKHDRVPLVINMSLEEDSANSVMQGEIADARNNGAVIVAASGNGGSDNKALSTVSYPAAYSGVIAVGAYTVDNLGQPARAGFSNYGSGLDILAPGTGIYGPLPVLTNVYRNITGYDWSAYHYWDGTSMASPYVASAAALLLRAEPSLTPAEVESYLERSAVDMGTAGRDNTYGWGRLDAYAAYRLLVTPQTTATVKARYDTSATITPVVHDRDSLGADGLPQVTTYYTLDPGARDAETPDFYGPSLSLETTGPGAIAFGSHTLTYWSVDSNGAAEAKHSVTFQILPHDGIAPTTTTNAKSSYTGSARISLTATDTGWGLASTKYRIDKSTTWSTGTSVAIGSKGTHTLYYYSTDFAGNAERLKSVTFKIAQARVSITIVRSASSIRRYSSVRLSGTLTPARVGDAVRIQYKSPGSRTWRYIGTTYKRSVTSVSGSGRGTWSNASYKLSHHGRYYFRVVFSGDDAHIARASATSSTTSVYVH